MADIKEKASVSVCTPETEEKETAELTEEQNARNIEQAEEAKLRARMPLMNKPGSAFLQRRLGKGLKYFDSGDYQMALQKPQKGARMPPLLAGNTGGAIPTPETVPARKTSLIQQPKLTPSATSGGVVG